MLTVNAASGFGSGGAAGRADIGDAPQTNLVSHFRADLGITIATGVSTWEDQVGNNDFTQATTSRQPIYSATSGANGLDGVEFEAGANPDWMNAAGIVLSQPYHVFVVGMHKEFSTDGIPFWTGLDPSTTQLQHAASTPDLKLAAGIGGNHCVNGDATIGEFSLIESFLSGASSHITVNNGTAATGNPGSLGLPNGVRLTTGGGITFGSNINSVISEMLFYDTAEVTGSTLTALYTYLNSQYDLF